MAFIIDNKFLGDRCIGQLSPVLYKIFVDMRMERVMERDVFLLNYHWKEINPINCGWQRCNSGHAFGPATRFYWLLHYVVRGKGVYYVQGKEYPVRAGQFFVIRPFEVTRYEADQHEPWEYIWIGFTSGLKLPQCLQQEYVINAARCAGLFSSLKEAADMKEGRELYLCGKIYELLAQLSEKREGEEDYIELAKTYIESNYMRELSIQELSEKLNLNRSYFSTLFHRKTGRSPQQYLTNCRMEKASQLMIEHGYSPGEAALAVGYPDIFSFSRMFKRYFGISPRQYVKMHTSSDK